MQKNDAEGRLKTNEKKGGLTRGENGDGNDGADDGGSLNLFFLDKR
jgi:hypothetical protein